MEAHFPTTETVVLDRADIAQAYQLFLGRSPDFRSASPAFSSRAQRPQIELCATGDMAALLCNVLQSAEFQSGTLEKLLLRQPLPQSSINSAPPWRLIDWAQRKLPLAPRTRRIIGAAKTWPELLEVLLSDKELVRLAASLEEAGIDAVFRERVQVHPISRVDRSVIGSVDSASGFAVSGWAVDLCDKSAPVTVHVFADSSLVGIAVCDHLRPDLIDFVGGSGNFGFTLEIDAVHRAGFAAGRSLRVVDSWSGEQIGPATMVYADTVRSGDLIAALRSELQHVRATLERIEAQLPRVAALSSTPLDAYDEYWQRYYRLSKHELTRQRERSYAFAYLPLISVVVPAWNSNISLLDEAIHSVLDQSYEKWELIVCDDASTHTELPLFLSRFENESRVRCIRVDQRLGVAANTNAGIEAARGEYVAFLDHDDRLSADALYAVVHSLQERPYALLYSDEDRIEEDETGGIIHHTPFFKPAFDPDLLLGFNYICHLAVIRRDALNACGGLQGGCDGAQDHDLLLRLSAAIAPAEIRHIPRVLYHWRVTPGSLSHRSGAAEPIQRAIERVVNGHLRRLSMNAIAEKHSDPIGPERPYATRVRWRVQEAAPPVSLIVPTRDRIDLLRPCIQSILETRGLYPSTCEIVLIDNESEEEQSKSYLEELQRREAIRVLRFHGPFNWSAINNYGARNAAGALLIFINNDTAVFTKNWICELAAHATRKDVGAVGARLLYANGTLQHAGVVIGHEGVAGHEYVGASAVEGGYFSRTQFVRSAGAVTGACLATRKDLFFELGGFDEVHLKVAFNDVDYCMRVRQTGYRVVYNPFCILYHYESQSRGRETLDAQQLRHGREMATFRTRWSGSLDDPYYNPHFERSARPFERLAPPVPPEWVPRYKI